MKRLIVGLGNPGKEYEKSRHSVGFMAADFLAEQFGNSSFKFEKKLNAEITEGALPNFQRKLERARKVIFVKPQTFMNESGKVVKKLIGNWKLGIRNLVIIHDDLDIPFGKVKMSFARSSAGHKGVKSLIKALKTEKFWRLRIGTFNKELQKIKSGNLPKTKKIKMITDFVIDDFSANEQKQLSKILKAALDKLFAALK